MCGAVVEFQGVSRRFGYQPALSDVSFSMHPGLVYGVVGANGAGKTTIIRHILGLLKAQHGTVRVFGLDPVRHTVSVLRRIGYLSERRELPEWMRIRELMWYTRAYYPDWDRDYCNELLEAFRLDPQKRVKDLSQGMRAQVGLIAAVCSRPDLLVLDEPSTGLDALVRRDILDAIIRAVADDGRTALFSSHLLDEVERMSDHVLLIDRGRLVIEGAMDEVRHQHAMLRVRFASPLLHPPMFDGLLSAEGEGALWSVLAMGRPAELQPRIEQRGGTVLEARPATLEEIFVGRASKTRALEEA